MSIAVGAPKMAVNPQVVAELLHECDSERTMSAAARSNVTNTEVNQAERLMRTLLPAD
jgi:hypothetical protein